MALSRAEESAKWLWSFFSELQVSPNAAFPMMLHCDNAAALTLAQNQCHHGETKHVDVHFPFVRELVQKAIIILTFCHTTEVAADGLTQLFTGDFFGRFVEAVGIRSMYNQPTSRPQSGSIESDCDRDQALGLGQERRLRPAESRSVSLPIER
jgi:hypothetical protein